METFVLQANGISVRWPAGWSAPPPASHPSARGMPPWQLPASCWSYSSSLPRHSSSAVPLLTSNHKDTIWKEELEGYICMTTIDFKYNFKKCSRSFDKTILLFILSSKRCFEAYMKYSIWQKILAIEGFVKLCCADLRKIIFFNQLHWPLTI